MANQLGKIYVCTKCGAQVIVTKGGSGTLKCCGVPMELKRPEEKRGRDSRGHHTPRGVSTRSRWRGTRALRSGVRTRRSPASLGALIAMAVMRSVRACCSHTRHWSRPVSA